MARVKPLIAVVACIAAGAAGAAPPAASFGARDPAAIKCSLFSQMLERAPTGTERQFYDWAQGYFAGRSDGAGESRRLAADGPARDAAYRELVGFCAKHPDSSFGDAVLALWGRGADQ